MNQIQTLPELVALKGGEDSLGMDPKLLQGGMAPIRRLFWYLYFLVDVLSSLRLNGPNRSIGTLLFFKRLNRSNHVNFHLSLSTGCASQGEEFWSDECPNGSNFDQLSIWKDRKFDLLRPSRLPSLIHRQCL